MEVLYCTHVYIFQTTEVSEAISSDDRLVGLSLVARSGAKSARGHWFGYLTALHAGYLTAVHAGYVIGILNVFTFGCLAYL